MERLKLTALDADDLGVISAAVQDSLVAVRDCAYFAGEERFVLLLNRFRWEADPGGDARPSPPRAAQGARPGAGIAVGHGRKRPFSDRALRRRPRHTAGNRPACMPFGRCRGALA